MGRKLISYELPEPTSLESLSFPSKLHTMIVVTVLLIITLLISPTLAGVLDDDVPREKAKMIGDMKGVLFTNEFAIKSEIYAQRRATK